MPEFPMKVKQVWLRYLCLFVLVLIVLNARTILLSGIDFYQSNISPLPGVKCRYTESCSNYAKRMIQQRGAVVGSILTARQLWQCSTIQVPRTRDQDDDTLSDEEAKGCAYGCCGAGILAILLPIFIGICVCGVLIALIVFIIRRSKR